MKLNARLVGVVLSAALIPLVACNGAIDAGNGTNPVVPPGGQRGLALAIGLNSVDPAHYGGWSGLLGGCEPDAKVMFAIAKAANLEAKTLLTQQATRQAVLDSIASAAATLRSGDLYVLSYSGHGGQVPDVNGDDPDDSLDETWCLFDGELIDDEIHAALGGFQAGVRVLVFSDSCHSGTALKLVPSDFERTTVERDAELRADWNIKAKVPAIRSRNIAAVDATKTVVRAMPPEVKLATHRRNKAFYDRVGAKAARDVRANVKCAALLISGCEDSQYSADLGTNGLFTAELQAVWNSGAFSGGHPQFHVAIRDAVLASNPSQRPAYFTVGVPDPSFEAQKPYTLVAP